MAAGYVGPIDDGRPECRVVLAGAAPYWMIGRPGRPQHKLLGTTSERHIGTCGRTLPVVRELSNAEMRARVAALVAGPDEPDDAAQAWGLINEDVFRRFPAVRGAGCGASGLAVMLAEPDPHLEERIRDWYGDDTTFEYGTAFAV